MSDSRLTIDPWAQLRRHTGARIALGRAGGSLPTAEVLRFALDHAEARDAVKEELNFDDLERSLAPFGLPMIRVETMVADLATYLRRPDEGRALNPVSRARLEELRTNSADNTLAIVIADGLSAAAPQRYAEPVLSELLPLLRAHDIRLAPLTLVRHARVALQDDIAVALGAKASLILLGERPGLHAPISLGAYFIYQPVVGATDEQRNCVSNIRDGGLCPRDAAHTLFYLVTEAFGRRLSGVQLKDERSANIFLPLSPDTSGEGRGGR